MADDQVSEDLEPVAPLPCAEVRLLASAEQFASLQQLQHCVEQIQFLSSTLIDFRNQTDMALNELMRSLAEEQQKHFGEREEMSVTRTPSKIVEMKIDEIGDRSYEWS